MSESEELMTPAPVSSRSKFLLSVAAAIAAAAVLASFFQPPPDHIARRPDQASLIGQPLPPMEVEGWFNGDPVTTADLQGQVVLVEAWAYWCGPCRRVSPVLRQLHEKYAPQGVKFIGLTSMDRRYLAESKQFIEEEGITWVQGYGASNPLRTLDAVTIPRLWLAGRDGRILWDLSASEDLEAALVRALKGDVAPDPGTAPDREQRPSPEGEVAPAAPASDEPTPFSAAP